MVFVEIATREDNFTLNLQKQHDFNSNFIINFTFIIIIDFHYIVMDFNFIIILIIIIISFIDIFTNF